MLERILVKTVNHFIFTNKNLIVIIDLNFMPENEAHRREPKPCEPAADGFIWVYDKSKGWHEVPCEIKTSQDKPFFANNTSPLNLPIDANRPKSSLN